MASDALRIRCHLSVSGGTKKKWKMDVSNTGCISHVKDKKMTEQMPLEMAGRVVIVTGGAGGVGRTVSRRWLEAGASVLVADHTQESLERFRTALPPDL